jgi:hypothetical protein
MSFTTVTASREELWDQLGATVQERVDSRIGTLIEWWADDTTGEIKATVLGDHALVAVEPMVKADGRTAYRLNTLHVDPSSFRTASVTGPTGGDQASAKGSGGGAGPAGSGVGSRPGATPTPRPPGPGRTGSDGPLARRIRPDLASLLGYLPPRAQELLQDPFLTGERSLQYDFFYLRTGSEHGLSGATLQIWCYLTDQRTLTFAAGKGYGYHDGTGAGSWSLTCWRADVVSKRQQSQR